MAAMPDDYITKRDLTEVVENLMSRVETMLIEFQKNIIGHMDENFATKHELAATETRLLRGYEFHARATESHFQTLDAQAAANFLAQAHNGSRISDLETQMREVKNPPPQ